MALRSCRECGANISTEAQTCPHCGVPDPTKDKSAAPDPVDAPDLSNNTSAASIPVDAPDLSKNTSVVPDPTKDKPSRKMIARASAGAIFILAVLAIIAGLSLPCSPSVPPVPHKEESLADLAAKYAKMTELELIYSLPREYKAALINREQGNRRSAAISIMTQAEAISPQADPKILAIIDAIIKKEEHTGPYLFSQGNRYLAEKQYDLAIQKFSEAISLGNAKSYDGRGMAWLAKHEYERAIADFTQAAKSERGNYIAYLHRAEANKQKGDRDGAIDDYSRALVLAPDKAISERIKAAQLRLLPVQAEIASPPPGRRRR
jgi:tetratricopeptide (TPR) repeat protein